MAKTRRGSGGAPKKKGTKMQSATGPRPDAFDGTTPPIDTRIQNEIGKHLRAHYDTVINEPVPDRFMQLLQSLEESVKRKK
jgi:hypothetical protein